MLLDKRTREEIAAGRVTLAFRRWKRPTVKAGGTLRTPIGVLEIRSVEPIDEAAITDEEARTFDVPLSFLTPGKSYVAEVYADGPGASFMTNPLPITISKRTVTSASHLSIRMAPGGGQAIRIHQVK